KRARKRLSQRLSRRPFGGTLARLGRSWNVNGRDYTRIWQRRRAAQERCLAGTVRTTAGPSQKARNQPARRRARRAASSSEADSGGSGAGSSPEASSPEEAAAGGSVGISDSVPSISLNAPEIAIPNTPWPPCSRSTTSSGERHS